MKKLRKNMTALLLVCVELLALAACAPQSEGPGVPTEAQTEAETGIDFFGTASKYVIVRAERAKQPELDVVLRFRRAVQEKNPAISLTTDWLNPGQEPPAEEILIGNTERPESAEALALVDGAGYVICVRNRKLVLAATTDKALDSAVTYFIENILEKDMKPEENFVLTGTEAVPLTGVSINGTPLSEFTVTASNPKTWELPIYTLTDFFTKYAGITLKSASAGTAADGPQIVLGGTKADGSAYGKFETELYFLDGDLHLGCANPTMAQKVIYTLIDQYLDKPGQAELNFPEGQALHASAAGDNWDDADPNKFLSVQDRVIRSCYKLQAILEWDLAQGISYTYENSGYKGTIAEARKTGIRCTNCVILGNWAMKDAGFYTSGIYNHTYDGSFGYTFSGGASAFFAEYFDVIDVRDRNINISTMWSKGELLPGDIIGYKDHNQTILPLGYAMDGGHGNCTQSGPGAPFARFVGPNPCKGTIVGFVFRAKDAK